MKKVLLTLIAVLMAVPAFAIEVYNNGEDTSVNIYGTVRGYVGYGHAFNANENDNFLYGVQNNSRIGVKLKVGSFSGQVELGANEQTVLGVSAGNAVGLRQAWGAYSFGNAGTLLAGKTDTPTSMSGFSSDIMDTDGGLNGFGGTTTSTRRFQIAYQVMGLNIAIIENDMRANIGNIGGSYWTGEYEKTYRDNGDGTYSIVDNTNKPIYNARYKDGGDVIPRIAISYTYKNPSLMAKVGATYSALNGRIIDANTDTRWATIHAFGIVAGVKPTFMDGRMWLSIMARFGMNEHLYGEAKTVANNGSQGHSAFGFAPTVVNDDGTVYNVTRLSAVVELGYKANDYIAAILGAGYQYTTLDTSAFPNDINSYAVYLQAPYTVSKNFALIPQLSWFSSTQAGGAEQNAVVLMMQARFTF